MLRSSETSSENPPDPEAEQSLFHTHKDDLICSVSLSGDAARMELPSAEGPANTFRDKSPAPRTFTQPSPADGVKARENPAEEMLPKNEVEAPSCVFGGGRVGSLSKNRDVGALCRSFCTSREHLGYLKDGRWRTGSAPSAPKLHLLLEMQWKRQCRGRMEMVLRHPARSPPQSGREMWAGKCQMGSSTEGIWENKLHRELKLTTIMFSEYFFAF